MYTPVNRSLDPYEARSWLLRYLASNRSVPIPLTDTEKGEAELRYRLSAMEGLQQSIAQIDQEPSDKPQTTALLYKKALKLYGEHACGLGSIVGGEASAEVQHEAMRALSTHLFEAQEKITSSYVTNHRLATIQESLYPYVSRLFHQLLSIDTLKGLRMATINGGDYLPEHLFDELDTYLFDKYVPEVVRSPYMLDIQQIALYEWADNAKNTSSADAFSELFVQRLGAACRRLEELSRSVTDETVKTIYEHSVKEVRKKVGFGV